MEGFLICGVLGILGLSLVGLITVLRAMFGKGRQPVVVRSAPEPLTRTEKLGVVWEVLGTRMPDELREEYGRLRGWRPAAAPRAAAAAPPVTADPVEAVTPPATAAIEIAAAPAPAASAVEIAAVAGLAVYAAAAGIDALDDDRPLAVSPEVAAAAPHAPHWIRSFLSFENTIFLLASCLVLGGTLYVVATTWGHVPGRWRHLFLEGVILFYGTALLGASALLHRRLGLDAAARFLAVTAGITSVGAAIVACAAFGQSLAAGGLGALLVAVVGAADARAVLRLEGPGGPAPLLYGAALALLAAVGAFAETARPAMGGAVLLAAMVVGGPLWLGRVGQPSLPPRALAAALPIAALLLVVGRWLPGTCVAPSIVAAGGTIAAVDVSLPGVPAGLVLALLQAVGLGLAGGELLPSTAALVVGLAVAVGRLRSIADGPDARRERGFAGGLAAATWCALAFLWARAAHLVSGSDEQAWAWVGASALPFAAVALGTLGRAPAKRASAQPVALATAAVIALGALVLALQAFPDIGLPSVIATAGVALLAYAWAVRARGADGGAPWVTAHALGLVAVWTATRALAPSLAMAVTASAALLLVMLRARAHRLVGTVVVPLAIGLARDDGAPGAWLATLFAVYGAAHLLRPVPLDGTGRLTSRPAGPPALVVALALALLAPNGAYHALVSLDHWPFVIVAGVAPLVGWVAWRGGPPFAGFEAVAGFAAAAAGGQPLPGLALATVLLLGRAPGVLSTAAVTVAALGAVALANHAQPEATAAALLVSSVAVLRRPLPADSESRWMRWLGMPFAIAAVMIAALAPSAAHPAWLAPDLWALVGGAALVPFAVATWRDAPAFITYEVLVGASLFAVAAVGDAFGAEPGSRAALRAACGALLAIVCGLLAAHRRGGRAARAGWIAALSLTPIALVPASGSPLALTPAFVAVAAMGALGFVSKRLRANLIGAWALAAGLVATWWALAAVAKHFSTGAPPEHLLPALAIVTALYGVMVVLDGRRLAAASPTFEQGLAKLALTLAAGFTILGGTLIGAPEPRDAVLTIVALLCLATLALVIAFRERAGWPFYVAESALAAGYAYLRLRTPWLSGFGEWDGVVACIGGFLCFAAERWLRRAREGLGADESRLMATLLPVVSAFFLRPSTPLTGLGPALGAAFLAFRARDRRRPVYGWLAAVLANLSLPALWFTLGVHSPIAYALPAGATLALLADVYATELGPRAGILRTVAALLSFTATSWEMFQFDSLWPAVLLAGTAVAAVLVGIVVRVRAYLTLGFLALVLDIVANLTRWGMHDRLVGGALGVVAGVVLFALGVTVSRHKELALARYRQVMAWPW
jgi:hypothetical protein